MRKFFAKLFSGVSSSPPADDAADASSPPIDASSPTGTSLEQAKVGGHKGKTEIENATPYRLVLREKVRLAYGPVRYKIDANDKLFISSSPSSTYWRLLVYADFEPTPNPEVGEPNFRTQTLTDTCLTIDQDIVSDSVKIVIRYDAHSSKFSLHSY